MELADNEALMLLNRSGSPRKGLVLANGVGLVDADYFITDVKQMTEK